MANHAPMYHPDSSPHTTGTEPESLRGPAAVYALLDLLGSHEQVHELVSNYATWERLVAASPAELGHHLGLRGAQLRLPSTCPPLPNLPAGVSLITRYAIGFPVGVRELPDPPSMLFVTGTIPTVPMLAIGGAENPTMSGVEVARAAALSATIQSVPVVTQISPGCSMNALRTVLDAGGRAVVVMPHGFSVTSNHQLLLEQVLKQRGAVITEVPPGVVGTEESVDAAARIVAGMASAVVLAEVGSHRAAGHALASAAVRTGRYVIVPTPDAPAQSGRYLAPSAAGSAVFASAKEWSPAYYGTGPRIEHRCANGLSPADSVVSNPAELATAISVGCRAQETATA